MNQAMRTIAAVVCLLLAASGMAGAQGAAAKIQSLEQRWTDAYRNADIATIDQLLTDDFIITVEDGNTYSKAGYIAHAKDPKTKVQVAEISDVKVRMHGDTAVVTGAYHEKGTSSGKPYELHDRLTDVWQNTGGTWRLIASHYAVPAK